MTVNNLSREQHRARMRSWLVFLAAAGAASSHLECKWSWKALFQRPFHMRTLGCAPKHQCRANLLRWRKCWSEADVNESSVYARLQTDAAAADKARVDEEESRRADAEAATEKEPADAEAAAPSNVGRTLVCWLLVVVVTIAVWQARTAFSHGNNAVAAAACAQPNSEECEATADDAEVEAEPEPAGEKEAAEPQAAGVHPTTRG